MEKQGMDRRRQYLRTGLLAIFILLFPVGFLCSQESAEDDKVPEIRIETSPADPLVNGPLSISILINHPVPSEVNVIPPAFPSSLFLERVRTEARFMQIEASAPDADGTDPPGPQSERWTSVEFLFTPRRADSVTLEPFEVIVSGQRIASGRTSLRFRDTSAATVRRYEPRLRWITPVPPFTTGTRGSLTLELSNWDPQREVPGGIFRGRAPLNAILEESPPIAAGGGIYRYSVSIIPLGGGVTIEAFSFNSEIYTLSVPQIVIPVLPALPINEQASPDPVDAGESAGDDPLWDSAASNQTIPFPEKREKVFIFFRAAYNRVCARTQALWEEDRRAEALAEIRRNERDSLAGPFLAPLRSDMEQALGLNFTGDENWRPLKIPLLSWIIAGAAILLSVAALFVFTPRAENRKKSVTSGSGRGFKTVVIPVFAIGLAFILLELGLGNFLIGRRNSAGSSAVLEQTPAFRVPDPGAAVNTRFDEGQSVIVGGYRMTTSKMTVSSGDWCYAESPDGRSGWVPREAVITY